jgi:hypothetical protein
MIQTNRTTKRYRLPVLSRMLAGTVIVILLMFPVCAGAQVVYDLKDPGKFKNQALKKGEITAFEIRNINTFLYDITISGKSLQYFTEVPEVLKPMLASPGTGTGDLDEKTVEEYLENYSDSANSKRSSELDSAHVVTFNGKVKDFKNLLGQLDRVKVFSEELNVAIYTAGNDTARMRGNLRVSSKKIIGACSTGCEVKLDSTLRSLYLGAINGYDELVRAYKVLSPADQEVKEIKDLKEEADEIMEKIKKADYPAAITKIVGLYSYANSEDAFRASSPIYAADGDDMQFDVKIVRKKDLPYTAPDVSTDLSLKVKVYDYWKTDFSTGLFFNFDRSKFSQSYSLKDLPGDTTAEIIHNPARHEVIPSVGALVHTYYKSRRNVTGGFSFGISTDNFDKAKYHLGGSLFFLGDQRLVLTAGANAGKVNDIASPYAVGDVIVKGSLDKVETEEVFKFSYFLSLSWNLDLN